MSVQANDPQDDKGSTVMQAQNLVERLTQGTGGPVFSLTGKTIRGKLNLCNRTVSVAVEIQDCTFEDDVDFRYCEFAQAVSFVGCAFLKGFNSGDMGAAYTVYRKDLKCDRSTFHGPVSFVGAQIDGMGWFRGTKFVFVGSADPSSEVADTIDVSAGEKEPADVSFVSTTFGATVDFEGALFEGFTSFNGIQVKMVGNFKGCEFRFKGHPVVLTGGVFKALQCSNSSFHGGLEISGCSCSLLCVFSEAWFKNPGTEVRFVYGNFGASLNCANAVFAGTAHFEGIECGEAIFVNAWFNNAVDFSQSRFTGDLYFSRTVFRGEVKLSHVSIGRNLHLDAAHMAAGLHLDSASVARDLRLTGAMLEGQRLAGAMLEGRISLRDASVRHILFHADPPVLKKTSHVLVKVDQSFLASGLMVADAPVQALLVDKQALAKACPQISPKDFEAALADGRFALTGAGMILKEREETPPVTEPHVVVSMTDLAGRVRKRDGKFIPIAIGRGMLSEESADFSGCTFEALEFGTEDNVVPEFPVQNAAPALNAISIAHQLRLWQDPKSFSIDPYLQMEKHYNGIGEEGEANNIFYHGCCHRRTNATQGARWPWLYVQRRSAKWGFWKAAGDGFLKVTTGYGVQTWRVTLAIIAFICAGTLIFLGKDAVGVKTSTGAAALASETNAKTLDEDRAHFGQRLFHRFEYSADLFIPGDIFRVGDSWQPQPLWREVYADTQVVAGWVLVPLLVASFTGIIRVNRRE